MSCNNCMNNFKKTELSLWLSQNIHSRRTCPTCRAHWNNYDVYINSLYQLVAQLKGQNTDVIHQTSISLNTWYHVALVRSSSVFSTYLNTVPSTQTGTSSNNLTSVLDTLIGYYSSASGYSIKGRVAVYRVYNNRALTATEIMQNFQTLRGRFGV